MVVAVLFSGCMVRRDPNFQLAGERKALGVPELLRLKDVHLCRDELD